MSSAKILAVDDSGLSRRCFVAAPLRKAGYEVIEATNGLEGLAAVAEHQPDVIVSDLLMPEMNGFEFIESLRQQGVSTPVIVASADVQETSRQKVDELDAFGFINKPFKAEELIDIVQSAVESIVDDNPTSEPPCKTVTD